MTRRRAASVEVVIAGSGPIGLMVAALLLERPEAEMMRVQLLDPGPRPVWAEQAKDLRVYALSRASQQLFEKLGLWDQIVARRASPYRSMRVWEGEDPTGAASILFEAAEIGEPDLGHIVEDNLLRELLLERVTTQGAGSVTLHGGVESLQPTSDGIEIATTTGETIRAGLLIGADGGESTVRNKLDMRVLRRAYGQHALVTHIESERCHAETALQRFLPGGPLAFLPLTDGDSSIVWSMPSAESERRLDLSDVAFMDELQHASGGVLGELRLAAARARFPLHMLHALDYCRPSVALVGDAAHCVHPLAGQGMNLGFLDAACLVDVVGCALSSGEHPGDERILKRYARQRKAHNLSMQLAFDGLERLFRLSGWAAPVRGLGLHAIDRFPTLKRHIMRRALALEARPGIPNAA